jgi:PIN domain nuclease of toxin-antitoxin system
LRNGIFSRYGGSDQILLKDWKNGKDALKILRAADVGEHVIYLSIISIIEIMYLAEKNKIPIKLDETLFRIGLSDNYQIVDLDVDIIQNAKTISGLELHDRLIVASARQFSLPILTNDAEIIKSKLLVTIWDG